ncbi:hypothetical protein [Chitinophaga ginsengisoli]|uniref:Uncharacterized protein n=1 Tax=Chitinophaga ginsengisoli TaxID=363837 RepID=A0A2P8FVY4_9BACT|nr:hypothetical protein [Chitinophaga ginsengisoli]PSL25879.1 hypothetical protein CLV42_11284 [Chitinophaga ginsengisoli]
MKNAFRTAIICIMIFSACSKHENNVLPEDNGCIERIYLPVTAHSVSSADVTTINGLFSNNQIANGNLRYYKYSRDIFQTLYSPYTKYDQQIVEVNQYTNGLRIFVRDLSYSFWDQRFHLRSGEITKGTSLDTLHQLTLPQLRGLFLASVQQFDKAADKFKDVCLKAEFGYYNLNIGVSYAPEVLVKAWRITPLNSVYPSEYPIAYYQDNGKLISYDNGIQTSR